MCEGQVLVLGLVVDHNRAGLLAFVFHFDSEAIQMLLYEHLLWFDLHVSHGVALHFNVAVNGLGGLKQV